VRTKLRGEKKKKVRDKGDPPDFSHVENPSKREILE